MMLSTLNICYGYAFGQVTYTISRPDASQRHANFYRREHSCPLKHAKAVPSLLSLKAVFTKVCPTLTLTFVDMGPELFDKDLLPKFVKDYDAEPIDVDGLVHLLVDVGSVCHMLDCLFFQCSFFL